MESGITNPLMRKNSPRPKYTSLKYSGFNIVIVVLCRLKMSAAEGGRA